MKRLRVIPLLLLFILLMFLLACPPVPRSMSIATGTVMSVTDNSASVQGEVIDPGEGISEHGHCWSVSPKPTVKSNNGINKFGSREVAGTFTSNLTNLANGTQYYVCSYATNGGGTSIYGDDEQFTTESYGQPIVTTTSVSSFTTTYATVGGEVTSNGGTTVTEYGIYWGTTENPRSGGIKLAIGSGIGSFSDGLTGLTPGKIYYIEAYAINSVGPGYGGVVSFTTNVEVVPPTVATSPVTVFTTMSAIVGGDVTQSGGATVTDHGIYWGKSENPINTGTKRSIGSGMGSFSEELSGHSPGTTYYVEAYAQNSAGMGYGAEVNYTTNTAPSIFQDFSYGGSSEDWANSIIQTSDGGFALAGKSRSTDGDITDPRGDRDFWVVKTNVNGQLQWQKSLGGSDYDWPSSIIQTSDGGYVVAGYTGSNDRDVTVNNGSTDGWIVKLNSSGSMQWQKSYGGTDYDDVKSIIQTMDGGYAIVGRIGEYHMAKLNPDGELVWGVLDYGGSSIIQATDGGYILAGSGVVKLDVNGGFLWEETFQNGSASSVVQTSDGGYIVGGETDGEDLWIAKLDNSGNTQWQNTFGGSNREEGGYVIQTLDGGYALAGTSWSTDGNVSGNHGEEDYWIVKTNSVGDLQWEQSLGGTNQDRAFSILQTPEGAYVVAGWAMSIDGDVSSPKGEYSGDYWVVVLK